MWYHLVYEGSDGGVRVVTLSNIYETPELEKIAYEEHAGVRITDPAIRWEVLPVSALKDAGTNFSGRYFRDAWTYVQGVNPGDVGSIGVDMDRAKAIIRDHVREIRQPLLEALDVEYLRAQEAGASTTDIVRRKQELRDLPQAPEIDLATTPQHLFDWWPVALLGDRDTAGRPHPR